MKKYRIILDAEIDVDQNDQDITEFDLLWDFYHPAHIYSIEMDQIPGIFATMKLRHIDIREIL